MNKHKTEKEIDKLVISQANDDDAWEKPITVNRKKKFSLNVSMSYEIVSEKEILRGTPVFRGTRVPVSALIENLETMFHWKNFSKTFRPSSANKPLKF